MASGGNVSGKCSVIFLKGCVILKDKEKQAELNKEIENLMTKTNFELYLTSSKKIPKRELAAISAKWKVRVFKKEKLQEFIQSIDQVVIICGAVNEGMKVASITKSFLIAAGWVDPNPIGEEHVILAPTPSKMTAILQIVANQTSWYYSCSFDKPVPTKVVSLFPANTYLVSEDQKAMAISLREILKYNARSQATKQALICHLMTAIAHDPDFKEVQDWAVAPSSSENPSDIMKELKEHVRCMMNGENAKAIFSRHTKISKSHEDESRNRKEDKYCLKHFASILVDKMYHKKLIERVVCVFDDYLTYGNTFETLRNLLAVCNVKRIIFVSIGKYMERNEKTYRQKSYSIEGDISTESYKATLKDTLDHPICIHNDAQQSLQRLKKLVDQLK